MTPARLPRRPRQHQLEDHSVTALRNAIPSNWKFREKKSEYGIDGEIEIFTLDGHTTGLLCNVQLKSTDEISSMARRVRIKTSTYNYWRQLGQPVLVVRWLDKTQHLFAKWNYSLDPTPRQRDARSFSFQFLDSDAWSTATAANIELDLRHIRQANAPLDRPIGVVFAFGALTPAQQAYAHAALDIVRTLSDSRNLPLVFEDVAATNATVEVGVRPSEIRISVARKPGAVLDLDPSDWLSQSAHNLAVQIICTMIIAFANARQDHLAVDVISASVSDLASITNPRVQVLLAQILARAQRIDTLFEFYSLVNQPHPEFDLAVTAIILNQTKNAPDAIVNRLEELYRTAAANAPDMRKATLHYSIFNIEANRGRHAEAIAELERAAVADPTYHQRDYFYRDMGTCQFALRQYDNALESYQEAERRGFRQDIRALQADCLFYLGKYRVASEMWTAFLRTNKDVREWIRWALPLYVSRYLWLNLGIPSQRRRKPEYGDRTPPFDSGASLENALSTCQTLLRSDAIDTFVWINLGVCAQSAKNFSFAEFAFIVCGLVNGRDVESWRNALIAGLQAGSPKERICAVIYNGMRCCGEQFRVAVTAILRANHPSLASTLDKLVREVYETNRENDGLIRLIGPDRKKYRTLRLNRSGNPIWKYE